MSPRILRCVTVTTLTALSIGGCSASAGPDVDRAMPTQPDDCAVVRAEPGLAANELNESLAIDDVDVSFTQREVLVEAGGGPCAAEPGDPVADECRLVSGRHDDASDVRLWRDAHGFVEPELAAGAQRVLTEDVTGYTEHDETFHWRAAAVDYPAAADVHQSPAWEVISSCDGLQSDHVGNEIVSLSQGAEPFLAARIDGPTLYVVETWISTDPDGASPLDDTETGLPPAGAVREILRWFMAEHDRL
ncbi:hypothetical protein ACO229_21185 [Promicromonospora sp. MS192]|uniref:hypothetical protein n=1 Tax=Promicromonospora sp. MS192 TaxID=3412684 RepID=UPI003C2E59DC